eukprot:GFUD01005236.1.p1 GENE.GFUD01005236.1~~GFUD01005236.1.p1  ORF type:complete len:262 (+),score=29.40 GFUD01005236.1:218-1003(+)
MSSQIGILIHIDFSPKTSFFGYFCVDSALYTNLDYFLAYFPQLLLCYSLHTYFSQETQKKIAETLEIEETCGASDQNQVMQDSRNPSFVHILKGKKKFAHSDEALHALKEVSLNMKKNFGKFGKHMKNITKTDKDETKSLLSSISTQLMYILLNSHHPLQMKMDELLIKIHDKIKSTQNLDLNSGRSKKTVCLRCGSDDTPATPTPCECGEEAEFCRCQDFSFVPILLNHSVTNHNSILVPLEGEEEIYPTRKAVKSVKYL